MADTTASRQSLGLGSAYLHWGMLWFVVAVVAAGAFFWPGIQELLIAWQLPEYSHGPLIPILSGFLFLRQLKTVPVAPGPSARLWPGVALLLVAVALGTLGRLIDIKDIVSYALILWVGAVLLICFGWATGRHFWPPVLHLVYMLPLPGALYYGLSTYLQGVSSELGVYFVQVMQIPVYLEGNIIDLGVYKLHVAEACSGLRYLFPIMSFSYVFAVLYRGPMWHKAILLLSAAPITVFMNSLRIGIAGVIVNHYGIEHVEGFSHFFEGWVIFMACVMILFGLAWLLVRLRPDRVGLIEALDLETDGIWTQIKRIRFVYPSGAMIFAALLMVVLALAWESVPKRDTVMASREPFLLFPTEMEGWRRGPHGQLDAATEAVLAADDYLSVHLSRAGETAPVELFMAWYKDQNHGGVHSPEICLPGAGWEIAKLERIPSPVPSADGSRFTLNRAIIQKGVSRMLVYYWYDQQGVRTASMFDAKLQLMLGKLSTGRNDSAIIRLITPIGPDEDITQAETRLQDSLSAILTPLPRFVPGGVT